MPLSPGDETIIERRLRGLVTPTVIDSHREAPFGPHPADLLEILHFLRRSPDPERPSYFVLAFGEPRRWAVGARPPRRGEPLVPVDDIRYESRGEAEHAVFLRRLGDYGLLPPNSETGR